MATKPPTPQGASARHRDWLAPGMTWRQRWARLRMGVLTRPTPLQRDWESGDPVRQARVQAVAEAICAELDREAITTDPDAEDRPHD